MQESTSPLTAKPAWKAVSAADRGHTRTLAPAGSATALRIFEDLVRGAVENGSPSRSDTCTTSTAVERRRKSGLVVRLSKPALGRTPSTGDRWVLDDIATRPESPTYGRSAEYSVIDGGRRTSPVEMPSDDQHAALGRQGIPSGSSWRVRRCSARGGIVPTCSTYHLGMAVTCNRRTRGSLESPRRPAALGRPEARPSPRVHRSVDRWDAR